jgi:hypothetical protein
MRHQPQHARRKKQRGNEVTPFIHAVALVGAWPASLYTVRHFTAKGEFLANAHIAFVLVAAFALYVVWEIIIAIILSVICVIVDERQKGRIQRILDRL